MKEIERPKIETASLSPDGRYGKFVAEPLERGLASHWAIACVVCFFPLCPVSP